MVFIVAVVGGAGGGDDAVGWIQLERSREMRGFQVLGSLCPSSRLFKQSGRFSISIASRIILLCSVLSVAIVLALSKSSICPVCL